MYILPQEVEAWYIIPALRRELSKALIKKHGLSYDKVGRLLGITKAAVSQYLSNKRASKVKLHVKIHDEVEKSALNILEKKSDSVREIQRILKVIRLNHLHCEVCGKYHNNVFSNCKQVIPKYEDCCDKSQS